MIDGCIKCSQTCVFCVVQSTYVCVHFYVYYIVIIEIIELSFLIATFVFPELELLPSRVIYFVLVFAQ
jgi:hypothetical protein